MKRIIYDYQNPHIVGKAKGSLKLGRVIVCIVIVALAVALIYILFFRKSGYRCNAKEYFVAVEGRYQTEAEANKAASVLRSKGGGGYIVNDGEYVVIAAAYEEEADAIKVANRYSYAVEGTGSFTFYGESDMIDICTLPERIFSSLSPVADDLNKGLISSEAASVAVEAALYEVEQTKERLSSDYGGTFGDKAKEMMDKLSSALTVGAQINLRYCLIDIALSYKNFLIYIS